MESSISEWSSNLAPSQRSLGAQEVTLSNCDREPIHIPGHVQPFAALVAADEELVVREASTNCEAIVGTPSRELLGRSLAEALPEVWPLLETWTTGDTLADNPLYIGRIERDGRAIDALAHRYKGRLIVELEPLHSDVEVGEATFFSLVRGAASRLERAGSLQELCDVAAHETRALTGFDRVMIYRFAPDAHGEVIAEARTDEVEPFLGLHYPASDIPRQARALALQSWVRYLPDASYTPVPVEAWETETPVDMSLCASRGVSRIHIEYLSNMGVGATLVVSLIKNGQLWGLLSCHHYSARFFSPQVRAACEFLGQTLSLQLARREEAELAEYRLRLGAVYTQFVENMLREKMDAALTRHRPSLLDFVECGGAAVCSEGRITAQGQTPPEAQMRALARALRERHEQNHAFNAESNDQAQDVHDRWVQEGVFVSSSIEQDVPDVLVDAATGAGVLAIAVLSDWSEWLMWFRPEELQTVRWAGNPLEAIKSTTFASNNGQPNNGQPNNGQPNNGQPNNGQPNNEWLKEGARSNNGQHFDDLTGLAPSKAESIREEARLRPRGSFAEWAQQVRGAARPWTPAEIGVARELRRTIGNVVVARADELARLNTELRRSNDELEAFAYVASHDLKEPLRGIHNFSHFLLEDYERELGEDGAAKLHTLVRLTRRMETLLDSLLFYSRAGRVRLELVEVDLEREIRDLSEVLAPRLQAGNTKLEVVKPLPRVRADRARIGEILQNFVTNAIKYNDKSEKLIEIGWQGDERHPVIWVRDNGLGIEERHYDAIFQIFKRLHPRDAWGGGTGAGLTIAKLLIERHGGNLWLKSRPGEGSTFYFSLDARGVPNHDERLFSPTLHSDG